MPDDLQVLCQRCGCEVPSLSPMRKWCVDCRRLVSLEQARCRKYGMDYEEFVQKKGTEGLKSVVLQ